MPRRSIYDIIESEEINLSDEYDRLYYKYSHEFRFYDGKSLARHAEYYIFPNIKVKGTSVNLSDFLNRVGIDFKKGIHTQDELLDFIEYIVLLYDSDIAYYDVSRKDADYESIFDSINIILEKTAHKLIRTEKGRIVVPNDAVIEEASEILCQTDPKAALELLKYNHRSNKGNVEAKKKILNYLGNVVEPLLDGRHKKDTENTVKYILNNFNIRHNNKNGNDKKEFFIKLTKTEIENWYDKLYTSIISLIIEAEQKRINDDVNNFSKKLS